MTSVADDHVKTSRVDTEKDARTRGLMRASSASAVRAGIAVGEPPVYLATGSRTRIPVGTGYIMGRATEVWVPVWVELVARCVKAIQFEKLTRESQGIEYDINKVSDPKDKDVLAALNRAAPAREAVLGVYAIGGVPPATEALLVLLRNPEA